MPETQNIEYKQSWHDEYLKWVCGFANAQGGTIYIGKDDSGNVLNLDNYKKLIDDIPNKIRNSMGISAEINLIEEKGRKYIEIIVPPYSVPISLRGRYYYRSGSTKHELTGSSLNEFLLKKSGKTWDDVVESRATWNDIDENAFEYYLKISEEKGRLPETKGLSMKDIFEKLRLTENGQLKRAAIILFGKDPGKFYPSTYVQIGRFSKNDADLVFQEVEEGSLINLHQAVLKQIHHKFIVKNVSFEGMYRREKPEYPIAALREAILNALVHRNYMGAHTQIRVYDDKITFWNEGKLPCDLTVELLKKTHSSRPRNRIIADVCFKGGLIDTWGRGTIRIIESCLESGLPEPEIIEENGGLLVTLFQHRLTSEQLARLNLNTRQINAVEYVKKNGRITNKEYKELNKISDRTALRDLEKLTDLQVLVKEGNKKGTVYKLKFGG